jgi:hypothetical protein
MSVMPRKHKLAGASRKPGPSWEDDPNSRKAQSAPNGLTLILASVGVLLLAAAVN